MGLDTSRRQPHCVDLDQHLFQVVGFHAHERGVALPVLQKRKGLVPMLNPLTSSKQQLYEQGIQLATAFLILNRLPLPEFHTYAEAQTLEGKAGKLLRKLQDGPLQGTQTGYYFDGHVFVNVLVTAKPSAHPVRTHRSFPGNKIDRTATGVVAHEVGHHVDEILEARGVHSSRRCSAWRDLVKNSKTVSGYEPVAAEAWAETMRLFILNSDLLCLGSPKRYDYLINTCLLKPNVTDNWRDVLNHPEYVTEAGKWIARTK